MEDNAQAGRVADHFAVIALAGEMAIAYALLPWAPGSALADCLLLYGEWLARVGSGNAQDRQILAGGRTLSKSMAAAGFRTSTRR